VYKSLLSEGCTPNLVTFNTLIEVYSKTNAWQDAVSVLDALEAQAAGARVYPRMQCLGTHAVQTRNGYTKFRVRGHAKALAAARRRHCGALCTSGNMLSGRPRACLLEVIACWSAHLPLQHAGPSRHRPPQLTSATLLRM